MNNNIQLTVVMPVYNEAEVIADVVKEFHDKVIKNFPNSRLVIAEDGSKDGTKEILKNLKKKIPFELISAERRKGYTKAFKDVLAVAQTDLIFFSDSDGQHEPGDILRMLDEIGNYDIVSGYKFSRKDPFHRIIISKAYNCFIYLLFGLKMKDIDSGFKLMRKKVVDEVLNKTTRMQNCIMSEFILEAYLSGYRIKEIPVKHYPRKTGTTVIFHPAKLPRIICRLMKNLLEIKFSNRRKKV